MTVGEKVCEASRVCDKHVYHMPYSDVAHAQHTPNHSPIPSIAALVSDQNLDSVERATADTLRLISFNDIQRLSHGCLRTLAALTR